MPEIPALVIALVIPAIIGLVNMLKEQLGLSTRWAGPASIALAVAAMVAYTFWGETQLFENIMLAILIGLAASGFYDLTKLVGSSTPARRAATD